MKCRLDIGQEESKASFSWISQYLSISFGKKKYGVYLAKWNNCKLAMYMCKGYMTACWFISDIIFLTSVKHLQLIILGQVSLL